MWLWLCAFAFDFRYQAGHTPGCVKRRRINCFDRASTGLSAQHSYDVHVSTALNVASARLTKPTSSWWSYLWLPWKIPKCKYWTGYWNRGSLLPTISMVHWANLFIELNQKHWQSLATEWKDENMNILLIISAGKLQWILVRYYFSTIVFHFRFLNIFNK